MTTLPQKSTEPYYTIPQASIALGIKKHALRRAVAAGIIPAYTPFGSSRRLVKLSEIRDVVEAGGRNDDG